MYELMVEDTFDAAHALRGYKGKCENLHGHTWRVQMFVRGEKTDKIGLVLDFKQLKKSLKSALAKLDHQNLNQLPLFKKANPSCENIAQLLFQQLKKKVNATKVKVWESAQTAASYFEE